MIHVSPPVPRNPRLLLHFLIWSNSPPGRVWETSRHPREAMRVHAVASHPRSPTTLGYNVYVDSEGKAARAKGPDKGKDRFRELPNFPASCCSSWIRGSPVAMLKIKKFVTLMKGIMGHPVSWHSKSRGGHGGQPSSNHSNWSFCVSLTVSLRLMRSCARHRLVAASSLSTLEKVASRRGSGRHCRSA